jgi:hypothetical protein
MTNSRHERDCKICHHPQREAIEQDFIGWQSPSRIAKTYKVNRSTVYLHAHALGLLAAREKNVRAALSAFIERCGRVKPTAPALVAACVALSKLNEQGRTEEQHVVYSSLRHAFDGFTRGELEKFAAEGILPDWYQKTLSETENAPGERIQ